MPPEIQQLISRALAEHLTARGDHWDQPPAIMLMHSARGATPIRLSQVWLPDAMWEARRPPEILAAMAGSLTGPRGAAHRKMLQSNMPPGVHGAAFFAEAWMASAVTADAAARRELERQARAHELGTRADRVEIRSLVAVDRTGAIYSARQVRGEPRATCDISGTAGGEMMGGTIVTSLATLVAGMLDVTIPESPLP